MPAANSNGSAPPTNELVGHERPRLSTKPARRLTRKTTLGYAVIDFADQVLGIDLLPWQRWWLIHALELNPDGTFRFRTIVTLVARQNGKTTLLMVLALAFMYLGRARLVLGSAQSLDIARESWQGAVDIAEADPELRAEIDTVRRVNGEQELRLVNGARYRIVASTGRAGRGLSVDLLILDELREHHAWVAWAALSKTTMARPNALTVGISNAGDDQSAVLNTLRTTALDGDDPTLALFEWSAPDGCELDDPEAWAAANPGLGRTITARAIGAALSTDPPAIFRTEVLCQRVDILDSAIDPQAWRDSLDPAGSLDALRHRVVAGLDVAPDGHHVTLAAVAPTDDGRFRAEVVAAWTSTEQAREDLPGLLARVAPVAVAWFPSGPAAALAPILRKVGAHPIKGADVVEACMALADLVAARRVIHAGDPLLNAHVGGATKLPAGDGWRFARRDAGHVDAVYALAGAVHLAHTMPPPKRRPVMLVGRRNPAA